jgi:hypothetical protein
MKYQISKVLKNQITEIEPTNLSITNSGILTFTDLTEATDLTIHIQASAKELWSLDDNPIVRIEIFKPVPVAPVFASQ